MPVQHGIIAPDGPETGHRRNERTDPGGRGDLRQRREAGGGIDPIKPVDEQPQAAKPQSQGRKLAQNGRQARHDRAGPGLLAVDGWQIPFLTPGGLEGRLGTRS